MAVGALTRGRSRLDVSASGLCWRRRVRIRGVVALAVMGSVLGVVATVILFFGIRTRVRASAGLRRLGAR